MTNASNYPQHTTLLALDLHSSVCTGSAVVDPPVPDSVNRTLLAIGPEELRKLAHQLSRAADSLERDR